MVERIRRIDKKYREKAMSKWDLLRVKIRQIENQFFACEWDKCLATVKETRRLAGETSGMCGEIEDYIEDLQKEVKYMKKVHHRKPLSAIKVKKPRAIKQKEKELKRLIRKKVYKPKEVKDLVLFIGYQNKDHLNKILSHKKIIYKKNFFLIRRYGYYPIAKGESILKKGAVVFIQELDKWIFTGLLEKEFDEFIAKIPPVALVMSSEELIKRLPTLTKKDLKKRFVSVRAWKVRVVDVIQRGKDYYVLLKDYPEELYFNVTFFDDAVTLWKGKDKFLYGLQKKLKKTQPFRIRDLRDWIHYAPPYKISIEKELVAFRQFGFDESDINHLRRLREHFSDKEGLEKYARWFEKKAEEKEKKEAEKEAERALKEAA